MKKDRNENEKRRKRKRRKRKGKMMTMTMTMTMRKTIPPITHRKTKVITVVWTRNGSRRSELSREQTGKVTNRYEVEVTSWSHCTYVNNSCFFSRKYSGKLSFLS